MPCCRDVVCRECCRGEAREGPFRTGCGCPPSCEVCVTMSSDCQYMK
ncbi:hypothetical protein C884_02515 [Kocuria palustris PEL]|uniref:Uncharacterized protein n=1 Tax=Kocuria palustris PEL TaxID=1236550 RepID=M2YDS5_9MICC|nr:hypothetical protein C884_02515 [Kocuria palustris PEL]